MFDYGSCKNISLKNSIKRFSISDAIKMCHSVVTPTGLEPVTSGLGISRSILMSYGAIHYETMLYISLYKISAFDINHQTRKPCLFYTNLCNLTRCWKQFEYARMRIIIIYQLEILSIKSAKMKHLIKTTIKQLFMKKSYFSYFTVSIFHNLKHI